MFTIAKRFELSASHILDGLAEDHPCGRLHGHNYTIEIELRGDRLDEHGFVFDYGGLKPIKDWIDGSLDHRHLNELVDFQPSAENLALWVFQKSCALLTPDIPFASTHGMPDPVWYISAVRVMETPKTVAEYRP
jgi:6-pyruvoyltetrahydropterin/6-carboxytetrahydropterin synthase